MFMLETTNLVIAIIVQRQLSLLAAVMGAGTAPLMHEIAQLDAPPRCEADPVEALITVDCVARDLKSKAMDLY